MSYSFFWVCRLGQSVRLSRSMHLASTPDDQSRSFCIDFGTLENVLVVCQHMCYHQGMKSEEASGVTGPFPKPSSIRVDTHGAYPTSVSKAAMSHRVITFTISQDHPAKTVFCSTRLLPSPLVCHMAERGRGASPGSVCLVTENDRLQIFVKIWICLFNSRDIFHKSVWHLSFPPQV